LLSVFLYTFAYGEVNVKVDSTIVVTPEGIGQHLSVLLINRGDIKESQAAININKLFPNEDFSKFEDSPANFILSIFKGYEALLPQSWNRLLKSADNLNLENNANYVKTFFSKVSQDKYKCVAVLKNSNKFYGLTFEVLTWEKDSYVLYVSDKLDEFNSIDKLLKDYLEKWSDIGGDEQANANSEENEYMYNKNVDVKIKNKTVPSFNSFVDKLTHSIKGMQSYNELISEQKNTNRKEFEKSWRDLISYIEKNNYSDLKCHDTLMNNLSYEDTDVYNVALSYRFSSKNKTYTFSCFATLVDENWCLLDISPIEEEPKIEFRF